MTPEEQVRGSGSDSDPSSPLHGEELRSALADLCRSWQVADLYVFGSRAPEILARTRGEFVEPESGLEGSDVDVGIRLRRGATLDVDEVVALTGALEELLDVPRVDVVIVPAAPPFLALEVIRGELLHCQDPHDQAEFELYVLRRAGDLIGFQRIREEMALSRYTDR